MGFFDGERSGRFLRVPDWLDLAAGKDERYTVELPMIQRGFVWKPDQIIQLWDSLLRGMPIGTLMLSEKAEAPTLPLTGIAKHTSGTLQQRDTLSLVDGQQRTLAMLMGWVPFARGETSRRLWVDLGDAPPAGQLLRLRVTTRNQPFGFKRDNPNGKLSMDHRRCAREAYSVSGDDASGNRQEQADLLLENARPHPAGERHSLPLDLAELVNAFRGKADDEWMAKVRSALAAIDVVDCRGGTSVMKRTWSDMSDEARHAVEQRIGLLADGLARLFRAEIPLLRVDPLFFAVQKGGNVEPLLAQLFERVGSKGTPLSNADYAYAVLKYLIRGAHDMVERLHGEGHVASLLSPTELVMSALRLATPIWGGRDIDNPSKEEFHRILWPPQKGDGPPQEGDGKARLGAVERLLKSEGDDNLSRYFRVVQQNLAYRGARDIGLPRHIFPYLKWRLVQVLLRMAQVGFLRLPTESPTREDALRLVLFWIQWMRNEPKASKLAFEVIEKAVADGDLSELGRRIYEAIVREGAGLRMQDPQSIKGLSLHDSASDRERSIDDARPLRGSSRFETRPNEEERTRQIREFYQRWWRDWNYRHPILLWLQRDYVHELPGDPMAGMDDDTPYDFDHILPQAHWFWWGRPGGGARLLDFIAPDEKNAHSAIGNAIGNVRVWYVADNRGDGDASPRIKMERHIDGAKVWMRKSAIDESQEVLWKACSSVEDANPEGQSSLSGTEPNHRQWNSARARAFQQVVEHRTFDLYERLYHEASFDKWSGISPAEWSL